MGQYLQLKSAIEYELEEKRSRFICFLYPVTTREEVMGYLKQLQERYPDARHHCWAYLIGDPMQPVAQAYSDDGEPTGTAGKPMLHVLTQRGAGDSCAIVVRYFGGIKLGAGGLVRAYSSVVSKTLDQASLTQVKPRIQLILDVPFAHEAMVRRALGAIEGSVVGVEYHQQVSLTVELYQEDKDEFVVHLGEISSGALQIRE